MIIDLTALLCQDGQKFAYPGTGIRFSIQTYAQPVGAPARELSNDATLKLWVDDPGLSYTAQILNGQLSNPSQGVYYYDWQARGSGKIYIRWISTESLISVNAFVRVQHTKMRMLGPDVAAFADMVQIGSSEVEAV